MRLPRTLPLVVVVAALGVAACGGGDEGGAGPDTGEQAAGGSGNCLDAWNGGPRDVRAQASLSHRGEGADVQLGTYTGKPFTATGEAYDATGSSTSAEVGVAPGDCVAVDRTGSGERETNWVMVNAKGSASAAAGWYFLDEAGSHPLAEAPQPLGEPVKAQLTGFGVDAKLTPAS